MEHPNFYTPAQRKKAVAWAVAMTAGTPLAPQRYERYLLGLYQRGILTIEEVVDQLNLGVYQILYHSHATQLPTEAELQELLESARSFNAAHQITGLLLYSAGLYVQVLEGPEADVRALFNRIQSDTRHQQVVTVCAGPGAQRRFADWRMGFGEVSHPDVDYVLNALQAVPPIEALAVEDVQLQALLEAFSLHPYATEVGGA